MALSADLLVWKTKSLRRVFFNKDIVSGGKLWLAEGNKDKGKWEEVAWRSK